MRPHRSPRATTMFICGFNSLGCFYDCAPDLQYIYSLSHNLARSLNLDLRPQASRLPMGPIRPVQPRLKTEGLDQLRILASFITVWAESYGVAPN
jgi:hypothetical protein